MSTSNSIDLGGFSKQYAARDLPAHQKLKYRDIGQAAPEEIRKEKKELRKDLEEREKNVSSRDTRGGGNYLHICEKEPSKKSK